MRNLEKQLLDVLLMNLLYKLALSEQLPSKTWNSYSHNNIMFLLHKFRIVGHL